MLLVGPILVLIYRMCIEALRLTLDELHAIVGPNIGAAPAFTLAAWVVFGCVAVLFIRWRDSKYLTN